MFRWGSVSQNLEGKKRKIYASAVLAITTLDTAVFEIGAYAKWLLKIFHLILAGFTGSCMSNWPFD